MTRTNLLALLGLTLAGCAHDTPPPAVEPTLTAADQAIVDELRDVDGNTGAAERVLFWPPEARRVGFREIHRILPTRTVTAGSDPYPLRSRPLDLSSLHYRVDGEARPLQAFLDRPETIGLIVVRGHDILFEHYAPGNDEHSRWISFSVTKSITSMLIGAALEDGYIQSVDEPVVHYLPRLRGTAYEHATIRDVLQMASGVAWDETYADPESDVAKAGGLNGLALQRYLAALPVEGTAGQSFNYNTGETNLVGEILRSAIGNNAATYLTHKIWQPFGMADDAYWVLDSSGGGELGGCCLNATLRDYARLGVFAMHGGRLADGSRVLPEHWMAESTTPSPGMPRYGYLWWLAADGSFSARGIFGQMIFIDPDRDLVIAMHNSAPSASDAAFGQELSGVLEALRQEVGP